MVRQILSFEKESLDIYYSSPTTTERICDVFQWIYIKKVADEPDNQKFRDSDELFESLAPLILESKPEVCINLLLLC